MSGGAPRLLGEGGRLAGGGGLAGARRLHLLHKVHRLVLRRLRRRRQVGQVTLQLPHALLERGCLQWRRFTPSRLMAHP